LPEENLDRDGIFADLIIGIAQIRADMRAAHHRRTGANTFEPGFEIGKILDGPPTPPCFSANELEAAKAGIEER
jgi:hypothetical protein